MLEIWIQCVRREALCETARGRPSPQHPVAGGGARRVKMTCGWVWSDERDLVNEGRREIRSDKECDLRARDDMGSMPSGAVVVFSLCFVVSFVCSLLCSLLLVPARSYLA